MEQKSHYLISDAAKQVEVESHVLRYWEEELQIPIKRNELGHRYYTEEDVKCFQEIKNLKEQGLQLKAIRMVLKDGKLEHLRDRETDDKSGSAKESSGENEINQMIEVIQKKEIHDTLQESKEEKGIRLQMLLQHMISEAVKDSNQELCDDIKQTVLKEMDYQFRIQEEREEERDKERGKKEEEHFKKIDELLRGFTRKGKRKEKETEESRFGARKKHSIV